MPKILMLHGPNHNMFGHREPSLYGTITYEELNEKLIKLADELGVELEIFQTNFEGQFIEKIHEAFYNKVDAVITNPGGWTNYTISVKDAFAILAQNDIPVLEVHMANLFKKHGGTVRGDTSMLAAGILLGMGARCYTLALRAAVEIIEEKQNS